MKTHFATDAINTVSPIDSLKTEGYKLGDIPAPENHNWLFGQLGPYRGIDQLEDVADPALVEQLFVDSPADTAPLTALATTGVLAGVVDQVACTSASVIVASFAIAPNLIQEYSRDLTTVIRTYTLTVIALSVFTKLVSNGRYIVAAHGNFVSIWDRQTTGGSPVPIAQVSVSAAVQDLAIAGDAVLVSHTPFGGVNVRRITLATGAIADSVLIGTAARALAYSRTGALAVADATAVSLRVVDPFTVGMPTISSAALSNGTDDPGTMQTDGKVCFVGQDGSGTGLAQERGIFNANDAGDLIGGTTGVATLLSITPESVLVSTGVNLYHIDRVSGLTDHRVTLPSTIASMDNDGARVYMAVGSTVVAHSTGAVSQRYKRAEPTVNVNAYPLLLQPLGA